MEDDGLVADCTRISRGRTKDLAARCNLSDRSWSEQLRPRDERKGSTDVSPASRKGSPPPAHAPAHPGREHHTPRTLRTIMPRSRAHPGNKSDDIPIQSARARPRLGTSRRATRQMARSSPSWTKWITRARRGRVRGERANAVRDRRRASAGLVEARRESKLLGGRGNRGQDQICSRFCT